MADLARQMFRDCTYDLKEITQCRDCYRFATEKPNKLWYCKPCRPFHELVSLFELLKEGCLYIYLGSVSMVSMEPSDFEIKVGSIYEMYLLM